MKKNILKAVSLSLLSAVVFSGCTGNEVMPNNATQTGALTGALAGAAIGYNTKGHHSGQRALIGGLLGAAIGGGIGNAIDSNNPPPQQTGGWQ